ncbi:MAG: substrate-binding domain-containing protein [Desulfobacterales bacterium]|nr:substrate-binding domain-containing protein [Desulfobacterales bacterium]
MKTIIKVFIFLVFLVFLDCAYAEVIIICNKDVPANSLTFSEISKIFHCEKLFWNNGKPAIVVIQKDKDIHKDFTKIYLKKTSFQYMNYFKKLIFTGKGQPPRSFAKEDELIDFVAKTSGCIGYISSESYEENENIKIIDVTK